MPSPANCDRKNTFKCPVKLKTDRKNTSKCPVKQKATVKIH